jgi:hypothetical protein
MGQIRRISKYIFKYNTHNGAFKVEIIKLNWLSLSDPDITFAGLTRIDGCEELPESK